jgi:DNA repair protein RecO (recombination protein O)
MALDGMAGSRIAFHVREGGLLCQACGAAQPGHVPLSKGTAKLLRWVLNANLAHLERIRFSRHSIEEGLRLLDAFVPYHLGRETKSAKMLNDLRNL